MIKAKVLPTLKQRVEALADEDTRYRSAAGVVEAAIGFYLECYAIAGGRLDNNNFPEVPGFKMTPVAFPKVNYEHHPRGTPSRKRTANANPL